MKKYITFGNIVKAMFIVFLYALGFHWGAMGVIPIGVGTIIAIESKWI